MGNCCQSSTTTTGGKSPATPATTAAGGPPTDGAAARWGGPAEQSRAPPILKPTKGARMACARMRKGDILEEYSFEDKVLGEIDREKDEGVCVFGACVASVDKVPR